MRGDRTPTQEQSPTQHNSSSTNNRPAASDNTEYAAAATLHADMPLTAARFPVTIHPRLQQAGLTLSPTTLPASRPKARPSSRRSIRAQHGISHQRTIRRCSKPTRQNTPPPTADGALQARARAKKFRQSLSSGPSLTASSISTVAQRHTMTCS